MANTREHRYAVSLTWNGNLGTGTSGYRDYSRDYEIGADGKAAIHGSGFSGRPLPLEPRRAARGVAVGLPQTLVSASCRRSWDHRNSIYRSCRGSDGGRRDGVGRFKGVVLHPTVTVAKGDPERARTLHKPAHEKCFIANSVNFAVECEPEIVVAD